MGVGGEGGVLRGEREEQGAPGAQAACPLRTRREGQTESEGLVTSLSHSSRGRCVRAPSGSPGETRRSGRVAGGRGEVPVCVTRFCRVSVLRLSAWGVGGGRLMSLSYLSETPSCGALVWLDSSVFVFLLLTLLSCFSGVGKGGGGGGAFLSPGCTVIYTHIFIFF